MQINTEAVDLPDGQKFTCTKTSGYLFPKLKFAVAGDLDWPDEYEVTAGPSQSAFTYRVGGVIAGAGYKVNDNLDLGLYTKRKDHEGTIRSAIEFKGSILVRDGSRYTNMNPIFTFIHKTYLLSTL